MFVKKANKKQVKNEKSYLKYLYNIKIINYTIVSKNIVAVDYYYNIKERAVL